MPQYDNNDPVSKICAISLAIRLMSLKLGFCVLFCLFHFNNIFLYNFLLVSSEDSIILGA